MKPTLISFFTRLSKQGKRVGRKTRLLLLVPMFILSGIGSGDNLSAQSILAFDSIGLIGMPDTVANGEQWLIGAVVRNYSAIDSITPNDSVQIVGYIDSLTGPVTLFSFPPVMVSILPNDTEFFVLPILFDASPPGNAFRIGNNVIVVWPITSNPNFYTGDSISVNVLVLDGISTGPEPEGGDVRCYPVPASGPLYVTSTNRELVVKQIVIRDASGKIVAVSNNPATGIITDDWAAGIYMLEITFDNGKRSIHKIIR